MAARGDNDDHPIDAHFYCGLDADDCWNRDEHCAYHHDDCPVDGRDDDQLDSDDDCGPSHIWGEYCDHCGQLSGC